MDLQLQGTAAIVTGATRGIGRAIARVLLDEGAQVLGTGRTPSSAAAASDEAGDTTGRLRFTAVDLLDLATPAALVTEAVEHFGRLDIVVNNAASFEYRALDEVSRDDWCNLTTQKLACSSDLIQMATPYLSAAGGGSVVNVAGIAGSMPRGDAPHVGAVNAGIVNMTQFFAFRLASQGIRVNAVSPGDTRTDRREIRLGRLQDERGISRSEAEAALAATLPLGSAVEPDEVAATVAMLCSPRLGSVTGVHILVDGGAYLGR